MAEAVSPYFPQQIQRYEASNYSQASLARIQEIAHAIENAASQ